MKIAISLTERCGVVVSITASQSDVTGSNLVVSAIASRSMCLRFDSGCSVVEV
jgi:hypothetical protein